MSRCQAITKEGRGRQCSKETVIGKYCMAHHYKLLNKINKRREKKKW